MNARVEAAAKTFPGYTPEDEADDLEHEINATCRTTVKRILTAADAVMFSESTEAKVAELLYQMRDYTWQVQARAVIAALKGDST